MRNEVASVRARMGDGTVERLPISDNFVFMRSQQPVCALEFSYRDGHTTAATIGGSARCGGAG